MTPERWQEVKDLLASVLEVPSADRAAFLDRTCVHDSSLRTAVEDLLAEDQQVSTQFLSSEQLGVAAATALAEDVSPWIGRRVGPYEIVEEIGEGGMGEVYRAVRADDQYRKEVALKLVRSGHDFGFVLGRFRNERQILASLDHPNIAHLLDGGTTEEGVPYFVMELIEGEPITEYCDSKKLGVTERLKLFSHVCAAVQYAHQRLIVHRDIKPGNILVTSHGAPKLLDFGIAKILDFEPTPSAPNVTVTAFRAMTPRYASPEQINGEPMTTASDVYSLGVVLYELLTGRSPYRLATGTPQEIARAANEVEPQKPSLAIFRAQVSEDRDSKPLTSEEISSLRDTTSEKLSKRLRGDLDNIVLMALRKEPSRRYVSVEQFRDDLSRHIENLPITASRGTRRYRATKFIVRHKASVAAVAAITVTLLAGLAVTLYEVRVARAERARAEQRFRDMRELARSNLFEFHDAIQKLPGSAAARNLVIQRALGYLDKVSHDEAGDRDLMDEIAAGYARVADLQGDFSGPGIGDTAAALASFKKAFDIRESLLASADNDVKDLKAESDLLIGYITVLQESGKTREAYEMAHHGLLVAERLAQKQPGDREAGVDEAFAHINMGRVMGGNGSSASMRDLPEAATQERQAIKLLMQLPQGSPDPTQLRALLASQLMLAYHLRKNREFDASLKAYDQLWTMTGGLRGLPDFPKALFYNHRSRLFHDMGSHRRALDDEQMALALGRSLIKADPHDLIAQIYCALVLGTLGLEEGEMGSKAEGQEKLDKAIAEGERLLGANPHALFYESLLLMGHSYQGEILSSMGNQIEAQKRFSQALEMSVQLAENDPADLESRLNIGKLHVDLGVVLARAKRYSEAEQEIKAGSLHLDEVLRIRPHEAEALYVSEMARNNLVALRGCVANGACQTEGAMRLPEPNN